MVGINCPCGREHRLNSGVRYTGPGKCLVVIKCPCGENHVLSRGNEYAIFEPPKLTPLIDEKEIRRLPW